MRGTTCSALGHFQSLPPLPTSKLGPSAADSWVCVCFRTLWVSPTNSPVRLGVFFAAAIPRDFFQSEVLRLLFPTPEPWVARSVSLPTCSSQFLHMQKWDRLAHQLPVFAPPTGLDECFFFHSLVVELPYRYIF